MKVYAISDLHVGHEANRQVVASLPPSPDDLLILAGDVGDSVEQLDWALRTLRWRYRDVVWVPGNHDLWTLPRDPDRSRGEERYRRLVEVCHAHDVVTPEDPFPVYNVGNDEVTVIPLFLLYDYSFRPEGASKEDAIACARRTGALCADEYFLHPEPHATREEWCAARVAATEKRLSRLPDGKKVVLVSHFPLRYDTVHLPRLPQFAPWCGTKLTDDWHLRYRAALVVTGHLHVPRTTWRDGVRFEEVSLGYPRQWRKRGCSSLVPRQVLP